MQRPNPFMEGGEILYVKESAIAGDYPLDLASGLQGFRGMGNGCSVSGGWILKALKHEYIDKRVLLGGDSVLVEFAEFGTARKKVGAVSGGLHWVVNRRSSLMIEEPRRSGCLMEFCEG